MKQFLAACIIALGALFSTTANAGLITFGVPMNGAQEVPGPGDPDGSGFALLTFDDVANSVSWNVTVVDIDLPVTGLHIHSAPAGVVGPVVIALGTLIGGPLVDADVAAILASPESFYINAHNAFFPAGAIRGQLGEQFIIPEPSSLALLTLGFLLIALWRPVSLLRNT